MKTEKTEYSIGRRKIEVVQGSITRYPANALVCPANGDLEMLAFPGGLQYAFLKEGGEEIFKEASKLGAEYFLAHPEMKEIGMVPQFSAHITGAGRLPAKHVIHSVAVGYDKKRKGNPLYCNGEVITQSTRNVLDLGNEKKLKSIGFPALGTGLYEVPVEEVTEAMVEEFQRHLRGKTTLERLGLVLFEEESWERARTVCDGKLR